MKIVKFLGGLGNQMFQYAFYLALQKNFKKVKADLTEFKSYPLHNGFELEDIFGIQLPTLSSFDFNLYNPINRKWIWRKLRRLYNTKNAYTEESTEFHFDSSIFNDPHNRYYWGYWQHIDYINSVESELRKAFIFPPLTDSQNRQLIKKIRNNSTVSIHVRRGDYLTVPLLGGICDEAYYQSAISYMTNKLDSPLFVIFSNDIPWCEETFKELNAVFIDWNTDKQSFRDMQLMSLCDHNIIANSSFSWWGAWLNDNPDKIVISPTRWTNSPVSESEEYGLILKNFIKF